MSTFFDNRIGTARTAQNIVPEFEYGEKKLAGKVTAHEAESVKPIQKSGSYTTSPISVVNPSGKITGEVGEVLDIKNYNNKVVKQNNRNEELHHLKNDLTRMCGEAKINFSLLLVSLAAVTGTTLDQFNKMDSALQTTLLKFVMKSVFRVNEHAKPNVDKLQAVVTEVSIMYNGIVRGENGKIYNLEDLTPEEISERAQNISKKIKKHIAERMAVIAKLPEEQQIVAKKQLEAEIADFRMSIYEANISHVTVESAMQLLLITSVRDLGKGVEEFMEGLTPEIREQVASKMQDFEHFKAYIKEARERGEDIDSEMALESFETYHRVFGSYKNKESFDSYQQAAYQARANGELPEEVCRAASMGIGEAAYTNHVMSVGEKEASLQTWVQQNDGFLSDADMAHVEQVSQQYIQEYLTQHPEEKDKFAFVSKSIKEIVEATLGREFKAESTTGDAAKTDKKSSKGSSATQNGKPQSTAGNPTGSPAMYSPAVAPQEIANEQSSPSSQGVSQSQVTEAAVKKDASQIPMTESEMQIRNKLLSGEMTEEEAKKQLGGTDHDLIKFYVKDPVLRALNNDEILCYIETEKDNDKLREIAKDAPPDVVAMIVNHMRGDKADFAQSLIKRREVDFNTTQMLKKDIQNDVA